MKKRILNISILFIFFFLFPVNVFAASANISISGGTVTVGKDVTVSFNLNSVDDGTNLVSFGGYLKFDNNFLDLVSCQSNSALGLTFNSNNNKFSFLDTSTVGISSGKVGTCTFKTKKVGNTTVSVSSPSGTNNNANLSMHISQASITIKDLPSSNNNLSSLSINPGSINFNPGTTSYSVSVDNNVSSVNIQATPQDSKASVSGTGNRSINYGDNNLSVTVKAEDGQTKTYTIKVNRQDNRSSNNNLSKLSITDVKLDFNKNTTQYKIDVPYKISKLSINAVAEDPKAKVDVANKDLVAEATTTVNITVTAENGSKKVYSIDVTRGKDPNKKLSNNNYLKSLTANVGMLSPSFDKDKLNYALYLPYEITNINIDVEVEDTRYATIEQEGNSNLSIGNNLFKYTVTAEDNSTRTYTVTVVRNKPLDDVEGTDNTFLKSLKLDNASLVGKFDKEKKVYYYKKKNNKVSIKEAIPEIEENNVQIYQDKNDFIIMVETPTGERGFYILHENKGPNLFIYIIITIIICIIEFFAIKYFNNKRNGDKINIKGKGDKNAKNTKE